MSTVRRWDVAKDINTRKNNDGYWGRGGSSIRYIGKGDSGEWFRMLVEMSRDFSDMSGGTIVRAEMVLHTDEHGDWEIGSNAAIVCYYLTQEFANSSNDTWNHNDYEGPSQGSTQVGSIRTGIPTTHDQPFRIDLLKYIQRIAPKSVKVLVGTVASPGGAKDDHGLLLRSPDEGSNQYSVAVFSADPSTASHSRPYMEIEFEPANTPPTATWGGPLGASSSDANYVGTYYDPDGDRAAGAQVQVWRVSDDPSSDPPRYDSKEVPWNGSWPDGQYIVPPPKTPLPRNLNGVAIQYEGQARVWDTRGKDPGPFTSRASGRFTVQSVDPTVTPTPLGTRLNLQTTRFRAPWTFDATAIRVESYIVQLTDRSDSGVWADPIWEHTFAPTADEQTNKRADFVYLGPSLPIGDYSWRIKVTDGLNVDSAWGQDNTLHLTQGTPTASDPPDFTTVYGRGGITTRLVMRAVDTAHQRRPGAVVAIIENPYNLGVTGNASTPGQLYFSLPNKHPQISVMEPMRTHWSLQQYRGGEWKELTAGMLTDFDATENDTVFNGLDYLGMLSLSIETQAQPEGTDTKHTEAQWGKGGAKYVQKTISFIINDQLTRCIAAPNSPLGFFTIPSGGVDSMNEKVSIHSAYAQRLDFIRGLMDSHRGGATGRKSRISASQNPLNGNYEFTVRSSAGRQRPNLMFQYGGLVQAYRVMALGDWADRIYAVGRYRNQLQPHYLNMTAPGVDLTDWGEIAKANVWQDVSDLNDLTRRARLMAIQASRAGKRIAMGLRVHSIALLDGWSICDDIQIDIEHGSVSTPDYGTSGWWTIWGWEWRLYPDGHDELTLVTQPTEGVGAPVDDLIPSVPIHIQPEWTVRHGPPTPTS